MTAARMLPPHLRTPAIRQIANALDRGDTLMLPAGALVGMGAASILAFLAHVIGSLVIVCDELPEVTTRERVYA